ncbi:MAG: hypothetical protein DI551_01630 [Micavibrio aeruginosavorus]|uniref:Flagellar protein FlgN n=1 Tax=Micavibrio aeruginosavorus TaxID=349221 RepID=A0A2W5PUP1_9BACT|nr:MAG: hypothetical protein DI551_01630 [Micavibrio aeruginosavorus]
MMNKTYEPREKHYTPPADINVALLHTIIAVTALRDVLLKENEALENCKTSVFLELQDEKVEVARRYEILVNTLMDRGAETKAADKKLRDQLQRLQGDFSAVCHRNIELLERMKNATSQLSDRIMKSAHKAAETATQFAYGSSGKMQKGNKATIGLNERA